MGLENPDDSTAEDHETAGPLEPTDAIDPSDLTDVTDPASAPATGAADPSDQGRHHGEHIAGDD
jgi:hypothetical protein